MAQQGIKMDWQLFWTSAGVIITIVGSLGGLLWFCFSSLSGSIKSIDLRLTSLESKFCVLEEKVENLDSKLEKIEQILEKTQETLRDMQRSHDHLEGAFEERGRWESRERAK